MKIKVIGFIDGLLIVDESYVLNGATTIGRSNSCSIPLPQFKLLSRCHCTIARTTKKDDSYPSYSVVDGCLKNNHFKASTNGLKVNGITCNAAILTSGDEITLIEGTYKESREEKLKVIYLGDEVIDSDSTSY